MDPARSGAKTLLLIHHSHTDVGYTERQSVIALRHAEFIRQALAAIRREPGFKWVCETFWGVERFIESASPDEISEFEAALRAGSIGLSASYLNLNELLDAETLRLSLRRAGRFAASAGVRAECAMTADINGYGWGYAEALVQCGVRNLFSCVHTHHGRYPLGRPQSPFLWVTASGGEVLVWSGEHYHYGNELGLVPGAISSYLIKDECDAAMIFGEARAVAEIRIPRYFEQLAQAGYPYDFAPVMASGIRSDNGPPNAGIAAQIAAWNEDHGSRILVEMATLDDFFARLRASSVPLPRHAGDWPDWWSDGLAASPAATRLFRSGQRDLELCRALRDSGRLAGMPGLADGIAAVESGLILYAEHTFGHAAAMGLPWDGEVQAVERRKEAEAAIAADSARGLRERAGRHLGGSPLLPGLPPRFEIVNPWPEPFAGVAMLRVDHSEFHELGLADGAALHDMESGARLPAQRVPALLGDEFALFVELPGARFCRVEIRMHRLLPRVDVALVMHKESDWEPENLFLTLPFAPAGERGELWIEKAGAPLRPRVDQLPGTLTDFYCLQHGFAVVGESLGVAVSMPDSPLLQLGPIRPGARRLMGDPALADERTLPSAWLMNNFWETNFGAQLGGFHAFRFSVAWGADLAEPAAALRACRNAWRDPLCLRLPADS